MGEKIMQRTVKFTRFTYVENELTENNEIVSVIKTVMVPENDDKKALKMAIKKVGVFVPLKTEKAEKLYKLDDEIFFKYAVELTD